jgi:hypothetical protein
MRITFLGHQGWQFEQGGRSFLLDPILDVIGNGAVKLPIWPYRRLDFAKFEPLDAVIISHEHADHFSLPTLAALPKRCRIYISDLSSVAMATVIAELGFQVERFAALSSFVIAGISVTALPGLYNSLEPDTYALLMQDASGASFLTAIDTVAHPDIDAWLSRHCPVRTLDNLTNNFVEPLQPLIDNESSYDKSRAIVARHMLDFVQRFRPRRAVVSGQGWSFSGAQVALNHVFFSVDNRWLTQAARELAPRVEWFEGSPGLRFSLQGDAVTIDQSQLIDRVECPSREFDERWVHSHQRRPWTGVTELPEDRWRAVQDFVRERYGQLLEAHAPRLMERLYYLKCQGAAGITPTFAVSVRNGDARHVFALDYGYLLFREASLTAPPCAVGFEIWAADLELLLAAQEEVFMVYESSVRTWSFVPDAIDAATLIESFMWFTPRYRPREFLQFYRSRIAQLQA